MEEFKKNLLSKNQNFEMVLFFKLVINFFDDNNIKYYLYGGTLLGAIRNNGLIPWDDDIDICILEEDENKLSKLIKTAIDYGIELIYNPIDTWGIERDTFIMYPIYKTEYTVFCDIFIYKNTGNNQFNYKSSMYIKHFPGREIHLNDFLNSTKKYIYDFEVNIIDNYEKYFQKCNFKNYNELCIIYPRHTNSSLKEKLTFQGTNYACYQYEINLEDLNSSILTILTEIKLRTKNFDVNFYRQNNEDIAFYTDDELFIHWTKYGYYEGRKSHN